MAKRAFTLVEFLVAIAIIAILFSILVVGLRSVRTTSRTLACTSKARQCFYSVSLYGSDWRDSYPMFAERKLGAAFYNAGVPLEYWLQAQHWPLALRGYLSDEQADPIQFCPESGALEAIFEGPGGYSAYVSKYPEGYIFPADYWLSYATITDPSLWRAGGDARDPAFFRAVRATEVTFPSSKGLLLEPRSYHRPADTHYGAGASTSIFTEQGQTQSFVTVTADGASRDIPYRDFVAPWTPPGFNPGSSAPVLTTEAGVQGRDLR